MMYGHLRPPQAEAPFLSQQWARTNVPRPHFFPAAQHLFLDAELKPALRSLLEQKRSLGGC